MLTQERISKTQRAKEFTLDTTKCEDDVQNLKLFVLIVFFPIRMIATLRRVYIEYCSYVCWGKCRDRLVPSRPKLLKYNVLCIFACRVTALLRYLQL